MRTINLVKGWMINQGLQNHQNGLPQATPKASGPRDYLMDK